MVLKAKAKGGIKTRGEDRISDRTNEKLFTTGFAWSPGGLLPQTGLR
jgi:hypothetical protein